MVDLNNYQVVGVPNTAYYIPNFVTEQQEEIILNQVNKAPKSKWVQLSNRRLQNWGGTPLPMVSKNNAMCAIIRVCPPGKIPRGKYLYHISRQSSV